MSEIKSRLHNFFTRRFILVTSLLIIILKYTTFYLYFSTLIFSKFQLTAVLFPAQVKLETIDV